MPDVKQEFFDELAERLEAFVDKIVKDIQAELVAQGHVASGDGLRSIKQEIERKPNMVQSLIYMNDYLQAIDQGVKASKVPYGGNSGRGGTSKYIQGLYTWFRTYKGLSDEEALQASFATANAAKREGHPTNGSFAYSTNGRRTGFFTDTLENLNDEIDQFYEDLGENTVLTVWNNILTRFANKVEPIVLKA